jgi:hypothetical protein
MGAYPLLPHRCQASSNPADWPLSLCNEAEPGSLALRLTGSPPRGFDARITPTRRPRRYMLNGQSTW